jgi:hypothetical protein
MQSLIPGNFLSYYFTKTGYPFFEVWYKSNELLQPIYNDIKILTTIIDNSKWIEDNLRNEIFIKIKNIIIEFIENKYNKHPEEIYKEWIDSIQSYCYQGGVGYKIYYSGEIPHHWCVRPEYYNDILKIPNYVILSAFVCDKYIYISEKLEIQYWKN